MIYGRADPQDAPARDMCANCGGELYSGDTAYCVPDIGTVCEDCVKDWLRDNRFIVGEYDG